MPISLAHPTGADRLKAEKVKMLDLWAFFAAFRPNPQKNRNV